MAERLNKRHSELVIQRIKASQLLNRLQDNALGLLKDKNGDPCELSKGQRGSIEWLLERILARAEAPKELKVSGELTLVEILRKAAERGD